MKLSIPTLPPEERGTPLAMRVGDRLDPPYNL